jgi:hypothetical protein
MGCLDLFSRPTNARAPAPCSLSNHGVQAMTTKYFLHAAAILSSAIVAIGYAGPASAEQLAQATGEDTMARCQQLSSLYSRHNTNGYAWPLEVDAAVEDCRKGNYAAGVAALKRALNRSQIPVPPTQSARSQ